MSSTTQSAEARELSLVDKVEFRIALADSDQKLQNTLKTYLAPLLLKLDSAHASVRHKVITICQQVLTRIQPQNIQLPVHALLKQYKDNPQSRLIRHFNVLYLHHGIRRLSSEETGALLPLLVPGIASCASVTEAQGTKILNFLFRALLKYQIPPRGQKENENLRSTLAATDEDAAFLSFWFGKLFLLRLGSKKAAGITSGPGLSSDEWSFLTVEGHADTWDQSSDQGMNLTEVKIKCLNLVTSGFFNDHERFLPCIFASADPNSRISDVAEEASKRAIPNIDLEDSSLIRKLFDYYSGYKANSLDTSGNVVLAVSAPVRNRIMGVLARSLVSTTFTSTILRVIERDLLQDLQNAGSASANDRETLKLRGSVISYLNFVARNAAKDDLAAIALPIVQQLREFVDQEAQTSRSLEIRNMRGTSFEIIGTLAAANSSILVEPNLDILTWLFNSLSQEPDKEILVSIDEALSSVLRPFHRVESTSIQSALENLLLRNMNQDSANSRNLRYASIRFANRCLSFENVKARWIDLIALSNMSTISHEAISEAKDGLNPHWHQTFEAIDPQDSKIKFSSFAVLIDYLFWEKDAQHHPETGILAIDFCRKALMWESLASQGRKIPFDFQWDLKLDQAVSEDKTARDQVRKQLTLLGDNKDFNTALMVLWDAALSGMSSEDLTFAKRGVAAGIIVELCSIFPSNLLAQTCSRFRELERGIYANDASLRLSSAQAYGILSSRPECSVDTVRTSLDELLAMIKSRGGANFAQSNKIHGGLVAISHFISRSLHLQSGNALGQKVLNQFLPDLLQILNESHSSIVHEASFYALGQLCMFYTISPEMIKSHISLETAVKFISKWARDGNTTAVATLGYVAMIFDEEKDHEMLQKIISHIKDLHEIKEAETQFTVGEAIVCAAIAWRSSIMATKLDVQSSTPQGPSRSQTLEPLLDQIIQECVTTTKPALKKASVIWLLSFVQFAGDEAEVQNRLRKLQAAFRKCLSHRDDFVQEGASRGLALVYEKGNPEVKKELVKDLMKSFSGDRADMSGTVADDTQLFEPGEMPTGEGSSVNTYKDIMSLASEVGNSSLVYHFMSLASSDTIWSSRAAFGKFGLNSILSDAVKEGYLESNPKLYSKLYRYRFDPNSKVQRSMNEIWNSLVRDPVNVLNTHFDAIMNDLLESVISKEWRAREASCGALVALISGSKPEKVSPYLERLYKCCFMVIDDIKDSVRVASLGLAVALGNFLKERLQSDDGHSQKSQDIVQIILPSIYSTSWMESKAELHVQIAFGTINMIIDNAKPETLRPVVPELVENLLGLITKTQREAMDYVQLNAERLYGDAAEAIDQARASAVKGHAIMGQIEKCLDLLDETTMPELVKHLQNAMRSALSIPTKIGCSQVLMSLSVRKTQLFAPYADKFLETVPRYLKDRSDSVSTSYALALGYISRAASNYALSKLSEYAQQLYFESDDIRSRRISGAIVHGLAKFANDKLNAVAEDFLPYVFFALHDQDAQVKETFQEAWNSTTGGPRRVLLYLHEIAALSDKYLNSNRWNIKQAAALTITEAIEMITKSKGQLNLDDSKLIWPLLKTALSEKSWEGKEKLLPGFVAFAKFRSPELEVKQDIAKIMLREAKRRNPAYQSFAIQSLGQTIGVSDISSTDVFDVSAAIVEHFAKGGSAGREESEISDGQNQKSRRRALIGALDAIFQAMKFRKEGMDQAASLAARIPRGLGLAGEAYATSHFDHTIQSSLFISLKSCFEDLQTRKDVYDLLCEALESGSSFLPGGISDALCAPPDALAHAPESVRLQRSEAILAFARLYEHYDNMLPPAQFLTLQTLDERSQQARQNLQDAVQIFKTLEKRHVQ